MDKTEMKMLCFFPYLGAGAIAAFCLTGSVCMVVFSTMIPLAEDKVILSVIALVGFICSYVYGHRAPIRITLDANGLEIKNVFTRECFCADWDTFQEVYCLRGFKGHKYLLFASTKMDHRQQKVCWKHVQGLKLNRTLPCADGNVIFATNGNLAAICRIIEDKFAIMDGPCVN
mgnify:CR=1 FL=1